MGRALRPIFLSLICGCPLMAPRAAMRRSRRLSQCSMRALFLPISPN